MLNVYFRDRTLRNHRATIERLKTTVIAQREEHVLIVAKLARLETVSKNLYWVSNDLQLSVPLLPSQHSGLHSALKAWRRFQSDQRQELNNE